MRFRTKLICKIWVMGLFPSPKILYYEGPGGHFSPCTWTILGVLWPPTPLILSTYFLSDPLVICDEKDQAAVTGQLKGNHNTYLFIQRKKKNICKPKNGVNAFLKTNVVYIFDALFIEWIKYDYRQYLCNFTIQVFYLQIL